MCRFVGTISIGSVLRPNVSPYFGYRIINIALKYGLSVTMPDSLFSTTIFYCLLPYLNR